MTAGYHMSPKLISEADDNLQRKGNSVYYLPQYAFKKNELNVRGVQKCMCPFKRRKSNGFNIPLKSTT